MGASPNPGLDAGRRDAGADAGAGDAGADLGSPDAGEPALPTFTEVAAAAGLTAEQAEPQGELGSTCDENIKAYCQRWAYELCSCYMPIQTGGVAIGDVDGDGWEDIYLTALHRHGTLYRNRGDGTFEDITADRGLDDGFDGATNGAAFADVDRDGDLDLYVTSLGPMADRDRHYLFIQGDDGVFRDETEARGAGIPSITGFETRGYRGGTSVAVGDYDGDGWPDLHVNEWLRPALAAPSLTRLLRNRGAECPGCFEDVTLAAGVATVHAGARMGIASDDNVAFSSAFTDLDGDGHQDLVVVQDWGNSQLFWSNGDGTFQDGTVAAHVGTDDSGMGSTIGDIDGDGDLDWFVSCIGDTGALCGDEPCETGQTGNRLYRNNGDRTFEDATDEAGVRNSGWSWGTAFVDYDNDGDLDLVLGNGYRNDFGASVGWEEDRLRLWDNDGTGRFEEVGELRGIDDTSVEIGLAVFDFDHDGDLDILAVRNMGPPALYRNDGGDGRAYLRVRLEATVSVPDGLGAVVRVFVDDDGPPQVREVSSTSHLLGQSERVAHFGLGWGPRTVARVEVDWPSGRTSRLSDVPTGQTLVVTEPDS